MNRRIRAVTNNHPKPQRRERGDWGVTLYQLTIRCCSELWVDITGLKTLRHKCYFMVIILSTGCWLQLETETLKQSECLLFFECSSLKVSQFDLFIFYFNFFQLEFWVLVLFNTYVIYRLLKTILFNILNNSGFNYHFENSVFNDILCLDILDSTFSNCEERLQFRSWIVI